MPAFTTRVGRHDLHLRRERPHVKVVHIDHSVDRGDVGLQRGEIETRRSGLKKSTRKASRPSFQARGRMNTPMAMPMIGSTQVQPVMPQTIAPMITPIDPTVSDKNLQVRALQVEALLRTGSEQDERGRVHAQADHADDEHRHRGDFTSVAEPADGLVRDVPCHGEQQGRVGQGGDDLQPVETEGSLRMSASGRRCMDRCRGHSQAHGIGGHVAGVRQQCQRTRDHSDDHLHHEEGDDQDERDEQRPHVAGSGTKG